MFYRGLLGHVELKISKKLCKGVGLLIIYEVAKVSKIIHPPLLDNKYNVFSTLIG